MARAKRPWGMKGRRIEIAYEQAQRNLADMAEALVSLPNVDSELAGMLLPDLPEINLDAPTLYGESGMFRSKQDYEMTLRYLDRINRAASETWSKAGNAQPEDSTTLTSLHVTPSGELESEFMRREASLYRQRENKRRVEALANMGVQMKQVPVYKENEDGTITTLYSENRHPVMMWVPATGDSANRYRELAIDNNVAILNPDVPKNAIVDVVGDLKPASDFIGRRVTRERIRTNVTRDYYTDVQTSLYFGNIDAILTETVGTAATERIRRITDTILEQTPSIRYEIYQNMREEGTLDRINAYAEMYQWASGAAKTLNKLESALRKATEEVLTKSKIDFDFGEEVDEEYYADVLEDVEWSDAATIIQVWKAQKREGKTTTIHSKDVIKGWSV